MRKGISYWKLRNGVNNGFKNRYKDRCDELMACLIIIKRQLERLSEKRIPQPTYPSDIKLFQSHLKKLADNIEICNNGHGKHVKLKN